MFIWIFLQAVRMTLKRPPKNPNDPATSPRWPWTSLQSNKIVPLRSPGKGVVQSTQSFETWKYKKKNHPSHAGGFCSYFVLFSRFEGLLYSVPTPQRSQGYTYLVYHHRKKIFRKNSLASHKKFPGQWSMRKPYFQKTRETISTTGFFPARGPRAPKDSK